MKKRRVLVLGSTGMLGHVVYLYLKKRSHIVYAISNENVPGLVDEVIDAKDYYLIFNFILDNKIDCVINCSGLLNQACENNVSLAFYLNSIFPHLLGEFCSSNNVYFIQMGTDYVFSGNKDFYVESDIPDCIPNNMYSLTKSYGELSCLNKCLTIRTSIIGPDYSSSNKGLFNWVITAKGDITGFSNVFWNGVTTLEFAKQIEKLLENEVYGIVHMTASNNILSKYDLVKLILSIKSAPNTLLKNNERVFKINLMDSKKTFNLPSLESMMQELVEWIRSNRILYRDIYEAIK